MSEPKCYESLLLAEDLESERRLHCLACRADVGKIAWLGPSPDRDDESYLRLVSVAVDRQRVQGVIGTRKFVRFSCDCGKTSIYHLCL